MIEKLLLSLLVSASTNPQIREFVTQLVHEAAETVADKLLPELLPKLTALFTGGLDEFATGMAKKILDKDPDLPVFSDFVDVSEFLRKWLG